MSDLFDPVPSPPSEPPAQGNLPELSVSQLAGAIKRTLEGAFDRVRVKGELGRVTRHANGHIYLDLKDDKATINGVVWRMQVPRLKIKPEEGLEVIATGRITTFAPRSSYQLVIEDLELAGLGALMALFEKRKQALAAEGLFDPARKKPIPYLPEVIGVITSPSGAVIRDIMHRLRERFPRRVLLWPVVVQGERAASEVAAAIGGFNRLAADGPVPRPDLIIVARGGGSIEDLWAFNEEIVVRAAAASRIPLISAVGHETDTMLIDFASDRRAPTPTAAAEMAVPVRADLIVKVMGLESRALQAVRRCLAEWRRRVDGLVRGLPRGDDIVGAVRQRLDFAGARLPRALRAKASAVEARLHRIAGRIRPGVLTTLVRELGRRLGETTRRLAQGALRQPTEHRKQMVGLSARLDRAFGRHVREMGAGLERDRARVVMFSARLGIAQMAGIETARRRMASAARLLEGLSFERTLERGYAVVMTQGGALVRGAAEAQRAKNVEVRFRRGERVRAEVKGEVKAPESKPASAPIPLTPKQGRLL